MNVVKQYFRLENLFLIIFVSIFAALYGDRPMV